MELALILVFLVAYAGIALEGTLKLDKSATALLSACALWVIVGLGTTPHADIGHILSVQLSPIAEIIIFLMGAMTIVQVIDSHQGFGFLTDRISTTNKRLLLVILGVATFLLSSVLDNLATTIVMIAIMLKFISDPKDKVIFTGIIVIAANAGGAFSPIGDITTTMLWIGGQISAGAVIGKVLLPSLAAFLVPLGIALFLVRGKLEPLAPTVAPSAGPSARGPNQGASSLMPTWKRNLIFCVGIGLLLSVPVFKMATGLPPFMGMLAALAVMWILTEVLQRKAPADAAPNLGVARALREIDMSSILFFVGILLSVAALEVSGILAHVATALEQQFRLYTSVAISLGFLSAVFDNVPLVAASMHMYPLTTLAPDSSFWLLTAFCAGTGGSMLIIGSAAGVTAMGSTKVGFAEYALRIGPLALLGYLSGLGVFFLEGCV